MCVCDGVFVSCDPQQTLLRDPEIRTLTPPLGTGGGEEGGWELLLSRLDPARGVLAQRISEDRSPELGLNSVGATGSEVSTLSTGSLCSFWWGGAEQKGSRLVGIGGRDRGNLP